MGDFKSQVEEIESSRCDTQECYEYLIEKYHTVISCEQCRTDRILSAHNAELDRIAEGIVQDIVFCDFNDSVSVRAYIQAQKGS